MVRRLPTRGLTEGALLAALVAVLAGAARYLPLVAVISPFVCPLPLALLVIRQGIRIALLASLVAALLATVLAGPLVGAVLLITFAPLGIALGLGVRQRRSAQAIVLISSAVAVCSLLINIQLTLVLAGVHPYTLMVQDMQRGLQEGMVLYSHLGYSHEQIEQLAGPFQQSLEILPKLVPLMIVLGGLTSAWLNYEVGRLVLRKLGQNLPALPPMSTWRVPMVFIWFLLLGVVLTWAARLTLAPLGLSAQTLRMLPRDDLAAILRTATSRYPGVELLALNLSFLTQLVFSFQGFLVGWVLMEKYGLPRWYRWGIIGFGLVAQAIGLIVYLLGLADAAFNLRRRWLPATRTEGAA